MKTLRPKMNLFLSSSLALVAGLMISTTATAKLGNSGGGGDVVNCPDGTFNGRTYLADIYKAGLGFHGEDDLERLNKVLVDNRIFGPKNTKHVDLEAYVQKAFNLLAASESHQASDKQIIPKLRQAYSELTFVKFKPTKKRPFLEEIEDDNLNLPKGCKKKQLAIQYMETKILETGLVMKPGFVEVDERYFDHGYHVPGPYGHKRWFPPVSTLAEVVLFRIHESYIRHFRGPDDTSPLRDHFLGFLKQSKLGEFFSSDELRTRDETGKGTCGDGSDFCVTLIHNDDPTFHDVTSISLKGGECATTKAYHSCEWQTKQRIYVKSNNWRVDRETAELYSIEGGHKTVFGTLDFLPGEQNPVNDKKIFSRSVGNFFSWTPVDGINKTVGVPTAEPFKMCVVPYLGTSGTEYYATHFEYPVSFSFSDSPAFSVGIFETNERGEETFFSRCSR